MGSIPVANRDNHYEAAFEEYLRVLGVPYVAVDEAKRSLLAGGSLKSIDFIVSPDAGSGSWLVDVKGRRFPSGKQQMYWKNWSTRDDLRGLARWQELFGSNFESLLVFAYDVVSDRIPLAEEMLFEFRNHLYGFVAIRLAHYADHARLISPRWDTVAMPTARFRELAVPMETLLGQRLVETVRSSV